METVGAGPQRTQRIDTGRRGYRIGRRELARRVHMSRPSTTAA